MRYLSDSHLQGFSKYKYSGVDTSPLSNYIVHPYLLNVVVKYVPLWVAPNLLTFLGGLFLLSNFVLLSYFDFDYRSASNDDDIVVPPIPRVVWLYVAVSHFLAYVLDGIDGKQARRTKSSTPLGELFDHGVDSVACILLPLCFCSICGRGTKWGGSPLDMFEISLALVVGFYISHWEKYNTGTLYLPWAYDISQLGCLGAYLLTGIIGSHWVFFNPLPGISLATLMKWVMIGGSALQVPLSLWNIFIHRSKFEQSSDKQGKALLSLTESLAPWVPMVVMAGLYVLWIVTSPGNILFAETRIFLLSLGILFSNIACRLIICQMSNQPCELFNMLLIPLGVAVGVSFALPAYERTILYALTTIVCLAQLHYGICVVRELCQHFKIYAFSITSKPA